MSKNIYIFGAGGFAKEVFHLVQKLSEYEFIGFVDRIKENGQLLYVYPILSEEDFFQICSEKVTYAAIAIADNLIVHKIAQKFKGKCNFPNIIDVNSKISPNFNIGGGNIITMDNIISCDVTIGSFNRMIFRCSIGHDCKIGDFNQINPYVVISGNVTIGDSNLMGSSSTIIQGVSIGSNNTIGLGTVVLQNVGDSGTWFGNPGRLIRMNKN